MSTTAPSLLIISGDFHTDVMKVMLKSAQKTAIADGVTDIKIVTCAGSYEIPLLLDHYLPHIDAAVVLGYIEAGETQHGAVMGQVVQAALVNLQLKHHKPIGIGIIGPGATYAQAIERQVGYAAAAVQAAIRSYYILQELTPT